MDGGTVTRDPVIAMLEDYRDALTDAARLDAEAEHLEHLRKRVLAKHMSDALPEWKADANARCCDEYLRHLETMHAAKLAAGAARAKADYLELRLGIWRTREAGRRAQQGDRIDR